MRTQHWRHGLQQVDRPGGDVRPVVMRRVQQAELVTERVSPPSINRWVRVMSTLLRPPAFA